MVVPLEASVDLSSAELASPIRGAFSPRGASYFASPSSEVSRAPSTRSSVTDETRAKVQQLAPQVRAMIYTRFSRPPAHADHDDLFQIAIEGICRSAHRYDPARGKFEPYALQRAYGAAMDHIRCTQPGKRSNPQPPPISLDVELDTDDGDGDCRLGFLGVEDPEPPDDALALQLYALIDRTLTRRNAAIFRLHAEAGLKLREIAEIEGMTEARVCQILKAARAALAGPAQRIIDGPTR